MEQLKASFCKDTGQSVSVKCMLQPHETESRLAIRDKNIPICAKQSYASTACGKENRATEHVSRYKGSLLKNLNVKNKAGNFKKSKASISGIVTSKTETETLPEEFLYVSEYSSDIIEYLQKLEKEKHIPQSIRSKYSANHVIVVNWLTRVQHRLALPGWTLHTAVNLLDRAIYVKDIQSHELQLIACTALWIAAKCNQKNKVPSVSSFCSLSEFSFCKFDMYDMEITLLITSDFNLHIVNPLTFVSYYLNILSVKSDKVYYTCNYLLDIVYADINFSTKCPSLLAAAAVYAALHIYQKQELWKQKENFKGFYTSDKIWSISDIMLTKLKNNSSDTGPFKKYNSSIYNNLSTVLYNWVKSS
ncbi:G2/mitotic-specific cyclin S13-7-like isoform X2 [Zootermopsis nevadensis]|uniref:G2/mitotic-specific cyclin-2 n=2 Tax=Zootermopsis nevadensis TaxID=136037 RepID=A0A067RAK5_ZOONE|nr:G2/mitotic-specific cyclin S13-7-like isoform X2 [Zootermopsis nevadensis]XP_021925000.1 G2/mitotic-specific cyclin S13-7-like isoform X2 [Zootermopsis nevadensis]XP_021925001.1 G2/mitotic-specific cyclin S13-7-like isoform X2 [Zootermopsis nevadensis]XP_021925002.1 G2/mitotic-specific cyclin S13-7-like isoform X2 [Zootermopsis nevadensis]XP_021925003.1 G2/mitotic-specific cyclin S13-7-like isoform X2 [Zootermopsis nevadensis]XP_021925004.1 G2/mitotic-specific cyclin S13-7-like isoform X2 [